MEKLLVLFFYGLFSCGQPTDNVGVHADTTTANTNTKMDTASEEIQIDNELWTLYNRFDSIFQIKRFISNDSGYILLSYEVNASQPESTQQNFISKQAIKANDIKGIKSKNARFNWKPFKAVPVVFIQLQANLFKGPDAAIKKRQQVEMLIDKELKSKAIGQWIAGDLGPAGANMLFEVQNIETAKAIALAILAKEGLHKGTIIGRRINTTSNNWFYEVIYPNEFSGTFLTL